MLNSVARGDVAQLGEHRVRIAGVRGSSPLISTTFPAVIPDTIPPWAWIIAALAVTAAGLVAYTTVRLGPLSASEGLDTRPVSASHHDAPHEDAEGSQGRQGRASGHAEGEVPSPT